MLGLEHVIGHGVLALLPGAIHVSGWCCDSAIGNLDLAFTRVCALHGRTLTPRSRSRTLGPSPAHAGTTNHRQGTAHHHEPRATNHEPRTTNREPLVTRLASRLYAYASMSYPWTMATQRARSASAGAYRCYTPLDHLLRRSRAGFGGSSYPAPHTDVLEVEDLRDRLAGHGRRNEACSSTA